MTKATQTQFQTTKVSAMAKARPLFQELTAPDFKLPEGAKSPRSVFIERAISEIGLTHNGAATYYQNLKNEAAGKKLYYSAKKAAAPVETFVDVSADIQAEKKAAPKKTTAKKEAVTA